MFFLSKQVWSLLCVDSGAGGILQWDVSTRPKFRGTAETKEFVCNQNSLHEDCDL